MRGLEHKNINKIIGYGSDGKIVKPSTREITNLVYIILEYVPGGLFFDLCQAGGGMGEDALEHNSSREIEVHSAPSSCRHSTETSKTALPNIIFSSSMMEVGGRGSTSKSSDKASLMEF